MNQTQSHKDLRVWHRSIDLAAEIYTLTDTFPTEEKYGLTSQLRRAFVSIPSNIAEGRHRGANKDYLRFLRIALGSIAEIETQICIVKRLPWSTGKEFSNIDDLITEVTKMLKAMIRDLPVSNPNC